MRDPAVVDEILKHLRHLWTTSDARTVCGLVHGAADPSSELDFLGTSDAALLRSLRAMTHWVASKPDAGGRVTAGHLAALDKARDYDAASSYNYLNAELAHLRAIVLAGGVVTVEGDRSPAPLATVAAFDAWARGRYPQATLA